MGAVRTFAWAVLAALWAMTAVGQGLRFATPGVCLPGPQFRTDSAFDVMDWNGDGLLDLVMPAGSMMHYTVHLNRGAPDAPAFDLGDAQPVNFTELMPYGQTSYYHDTLEHGQNMAFGDLTGDGLPDVVAYDGRLKMVINRGQPFTPYHWEFADYPQRFPGSDTMRRDNERYVTGPESMLWNKGIFPRQVFSMTLADWNGDGLLDLILCRFKGEAPGVKGLGLNEHWTPFGRGATTFGPPPVPLPTGPTFEAPLDSAPARETWVYLNAGTATAPWFDAGMAIRADGADVAAPNPLIFDVDGDGLPDLLAAEVPYRANALRVDWPTIPHVVWHRRLQADAPERVSAAQPLRDRLGAPIPAGTQVRAADLRGAGVKDILVLEEGGRLRWYRNTALPGQPASLEPPTVLTGGDFAGFSTHIQAVITDWFAPGSRDLLIHGAVDDHCKWALRRTALYRNTATRPGEVSYAFTGWLNYQGEWAMVPQNLEFESTPGEVYGSVISMMPASGDGQKRLVMSVNGRLYMFSGLAADGLTFTQRTPWNLPAERNQMRGWQEIALDGRPVKAIRIVPTLNQGLLRDDRMHVVRFEALEGTLNRATPQTATISGSGITDPLKMLQPGDEPGDVPPPKMTTWGGGDSQLTVTLDEPRPLTALRFLLSPRDRQWYTAGSPSSVYQPYYWQNRLVRQSLETDEPYYQYLVEVSADGETWIPVEDRRWMEMARSHPVLLDWDGDGNADLLLGVAHRRWHPPWGQHFHEIQVRLYRNQGSNAEPVFNTFEPVRVDGVPLTLGPSHQVSACAIEVADLNGDGKPDLMLHNQSDHRFRVYRNVSPHPGGLDFQRDADLGSPQPIVFSDIKPPLIHIADVDGDGVPDLLYTGNRILWFPGYLAGAPEAVADLGRAPDEEPVLRWTRPAGATGYDLRWRAQGPLTSANWAHADSLTGAYTAAVGGVEQVALPATPGNTRLYVAVKSRNAAGAWSSLSPVIHTTTGRRQRLVLRNGPAGADGVRAYAGMHARWLDAGQPDAVTSANPLQVRSRQAGTDNPRVVLLRFADIPPLQGTRMRASLELTTSGATLTGPLDMFNISAYDFRHDWDPSTATFASRAGDAPWAPGELLGGGAFLAQQDALPAVAWRQTLSWEVTAALRRALAAGDRTLGLLLRVNDAGLYGRNRGLQLLDATQNDLDARPRLVIEWEQEPGFHMTLK